MVHGFAINYQAANHLFILPRRRGSAAELSGRSGGAATDYMLMGMSVTATGVGCVFLTVTVSTPLSNRAVMPLMSALSGNYEATEHSSEN